jgi:U3 small nucleolar RNA-associated protein MPP10
LTTSGLEEAQVWQQLELRAPGYVKVAKEIVSAEPEPTGMDEMEMEMEEGDSDSDSEGSMTEEDFRAMLEEGDLGDLTDEQIEEMIARAEKESGSEDEDDDDEDSEDDEDEEEDEDDEDESGDEEDEVTFEDGTKIGGSDDEELLEGEDEDEEEEDDEDEEMMEGSDLEEGSGGEEGSADEDVTGEAGPSRRRRHPTLDDQFFSIDDFNRMTEEAEAGKVGGKLDEEDEDLEEDVGQMMLNGADEDDRESMPPLRMYCSWKRR